MDINHLIEYMYLAETLSFKNTADYFYVNRSVISRHLAAMEESVGVKLVNRGNRSVQLTEAGKVFYHEAQTVLRAYANMVDRTRAVDRPSSQIVRIGYLKNAARPVVVRFLRRMSADHPDLQVDMTPMEHGELRRAIEEGGVDVAIGINIGLPVSQNYRSTFIYEDEFFAVMSKDNPAAAGVDSVKLADLPPEKLLLPESFLYAGLNELGDKLAGMARQTAGSTYYQDVDLLYLKLQTGGYIAFSSGLNNTMFGDKLAILPIADVDSSFKVSAFYRNDLPSEVFAICKKGFEACSASMQSWDGFSLANID